MTRTGTRTQILPKPISPLTNPSNPTTDNNLFSEVIQHFKGIKHPLKKNMQVRRDPFIPRVKGTNGATRTMTTNSMPIPQQSLPPRLSKPMIPDPLKHISNRLEMSTKEDDWSNEKCLKQLREAKNRKSLWKVKGSKKQTSWKVSVLDCVLVMRK